MSDTRHLGESLVQAGEAMHAHGTDPRGQRCVHRLPGRGLQCAGIVDGINAFCEACRRVIGHRGRHVGNF